MPFSILKYKAGTLKRIIGIIGIYSMQNLCVYKHQPLVCFAKHAFLGTFIFILNLKDQPAWPAGGLFLYAMPQGPCMSSKGLCFSQSQGLRDFQGPLDLRGRGALVHCTLHNLQNQLLCHCIWEEINIKCQFCENHITI